MPAERSPASRATWPNAVRSSACACSSTTAMSRFHMTCRRMALRESVVISYPLPPLRGGGVGWGAGDGAAGSQILAPVDRHVDEAAERRLVDGAFLGRGADGTRLDRGQLLDRPFLGRHRHRPGHGLDRHVGQMQTVDLAIARLET